MRELPGDHVSSASVTPLDIFKGSSVLTKQKHDGF